MAARREDLFFREIAEHIEDAFYLREVEGNRLVYVSPAFARIMGHSPSEGSHVHRWLDLVHPQDRERVLHSYQQLLRGDPFDEEYRAYRADGQLVWLHDRAFLVREEGGEASRVIGVLRDVTGLTNLQNELHHAQRMEALGGMAAAIAHDIGNVLAGIGACAKVISRASPLDATQADLTQEIIRAVDRGTNYIHHLLDYSRNRRENIESLSVCSLVNDIATLLTTLLGDRIELHLVNESNEAKVDADPVQLEQVLINLALNARDAIEGRGVLEIRTSRVSVDGSTPTVGSILAAGDYVTVAVIDDGCGIPPELMKHLFDPFFTTKDQGSGLGLSTAQAIVRRLGGTIHVESRVSEGSCFTVYLPERGPP